MPGHAGDVEERRDAEDDVLRVHLHPRPVDVAVVDDVSVAIVIAPFGCPVVPRCSRADARSFPGETFPRTAGSGFVAARTVGEVEGAELALLRASCSRRSTPAAAPSSISKNSSVVTTRSTEEPGTTLRTTAS